MNKVYVVQKQHKWDAATQEFVPKFDLEPAKQFGELVFLLSPTAAPFRTKSILEELREKLSSFDDSDHLLLIGNPALIGLATAVAADYNNGNIKLLQWSGKDSRYLTINANKVFGDDHE